ncbi:MAG: transglutaminase family protein [Pseudomonadota bacterium]
MSNHSGIVPVSDAPEAWLEQTPYVDHAHRNILSIVEDKIPVRASPRARSLAAFHYVRDEVKFGFARGFWDMPASRVAALGIGYCNTKSTLFVALLRAAGVPARQVFVDIDAAVLSGLVNPGTAYVDHSYVEVWLDGAWRATDAYIVDPPLFRVAQRRLQQEDRVLGYGAHQTGTLHWDGEQPAFSQFNALDPRPISQRHWGAFQDVGDFYRRVPDTHNRLNPLLRISFELLALQANRAADGLRRMDT